MIFKHMLTKLVINVTNETNLDISSIVLKGSVPTANIDWATMKTTVSRERRRNRHHGTTSDEEYDFRAIVVPQTAAFTFLAVTTSDNNTLMQKLASTDLVQGGQYSVNIRVLPDNIIVTPV